MRWAFLVVVLASACDRGREPPNAVGRLVFDRPAQRILGSTPDLSRPDEGADLLINTEIEVLGSRTLLAEASRRVNARDVASDRVTIRRVPDSMIVEVGVRHDDPAVAAQICNAVIQTYLEQRLAHKVEQRDLSRLELLNDVRVLDRCRPVVKVKR